MGANRVRYANVLSAVLVSSAACAEDDMNFLEDRPLWRLDTRVIADRDGGRGALIGLGWDTDHGARLDASHTAFNAGEGGLESRQTMLGVTTTTLPAWRLGLRADKTSYSDTLSVGRLTPRAAWLGEEWELELAPEFSRLAFTHNATSTTAKTAAVTGRALQASATYFGFQNWMLSASHYRASYSRDLSKTTSRLSQLGRLIGNSRVATADGLVSGLISTRSGIDSAYLWSRAQIGVSVERAVLEADKSVLSVASLAFDWQQSRALSWSAQLTHVRLESETHVTISTGLGFRW